MRKALLGAPDKYRILWCDAVKAFSLAPLVDRKTMTCKRSNDEFALEGIHSLFTCGNDNSFMLNVSNK